MEYTRSMRLRWGRKAPRTGRARRSRFPRRRFGRRRNIAVSSQRGNTSFAGFRGRKMPYRKYLNNMYNSTNFKEHHRSVQAVSSSMNANILQTQANIFINPMISDDFWTTVGGATISLTPDQDIFIRGGVATITYRNAGVNPVVIKTWKIKSHTSFAFLLPTPSSAMWDPSALPEFERFYNIRQKFESTLEPGDQVVYTHYIGKQKVETANFNLGYPREYWVTSINSLGAVADSVFNLRGHNLSFVTDRVA